MYTLLTPAHPPQINCLNTVYTSLAEYLNDWENWSTETEFKDALTSKIFIFTFINTFNSFLYLALLKKYDTGCIGCCAAMLNALKVRCCCAVLYCTCVLSLDRYSI